MVPEQFPEVIEKATELRLGLLSDEAGLDGDLPTKRLALVDSIVRTYTLAQLAFDDILRRGFLVRKKGGGEDLNPSLKVIATFENTLRLNLLALGLERRQRQIPDLQSYLRSLEQAKSGQVEAEEG